MREFEAEARMWVDLLTSESRAVAEKHAVTQRALLYMEVGGFPLAKVLDALKCSKATWYRRVQDLKQWQAQNTAVSDRLMGKNADRGELRLLAEQTQH